MDRTGNRSFRQYGDEGVLLKEELPNDPLVAEKIKGSNFSGQIVCGYKVRQSVNPALIFHHLAILQETMSKMKFHNDIHLLVEMAIVEMVNEKNDDIRAEILQLREEFKPMTGFVSLYEPSWAFLHR